MLKFDVIVVGAGPAGSHVAWLLARQGWKVALLDRERFPRDKVCGGGLSRKAIQLLPFDLAPVIHARVNAVSLKFASTGEIGFDAGTMAGCTVLRREFDSFLLEHAVAAGVHFFPGTPALRVEAGPESVCVHSTDRTFQGAWLLGADGVGSRVRRQVFGPNGVRYAPAVEMLLEPDPATLERYQSRALLDMGGMPGGYGWVFPKRDHLNVGVFSIFGGRGIGGALDAFVAHDPALARARVRARTGHNIPVSSLRECERGRVWLLGDAAGFVESLFGEGIYFALRSATLAARCFGEAGRPPQPGDYSRLVRRRLLPEFRAARLLSRAFFSWPRFAYRQITANPRALGWFAGVVTGEVSYRQCLGRSLAALPWWLLAGCFQRGTSGTCRAQQTMGWRINSDSGN